MTARDQYDVVAFGATGFTGGLVARYLARRAAGEGIRWAIAGRDPAKLEAVAESVVAASGDPDTVLPGIVVADVGDRASLDVMARRARVVLSTVGPFDAYGEPVVEAAIAAGADYVDITGEPAFVTRMIDRHDAAARDRGVRIVHCCGFDSVPHDLGALLAVRALAPLDAPVRLEGFVYGLGEISGGTWHSAVHAMAGYRREARRRREGRRAADGGDRDPGRPRHGRGGVRFEPAVQAWVAPLPTIDPEVVLHSARLMRETYGEGFRYGHFVRVGSLAKLGIGATAVGGMFALAQLPPTRALLLRWKKPGDGPSEETRARSRFHVALVGRSGDRTVRVDVRGGDPGYGETAKMVAESALTLAVDRPRATARRCGVITPASACGTALVERLRAAGMEFEVASS